MRWPDRIGRRVKLHDLHILLAVVQWGSMSKAATHLAAAHRALARLQMTSWKRETAAELALLG